MAGQKKLPLPRCLEVLRLGLCTLDILGLLCPRHNVLESYLHFSPDWGGGTLLRHLILKEFVAPI
jgi:hypothetical protein